MAASFKSVDEYLASRPESTRPVLDQVRRAIREALPGAEECISYQMPAYRVGGRVAIYFAGWKKHYSLYPVSRNLVAGLVGDRALLDVNEKGTARFRLDAPVSADLIGRIARALAAGLEKAEPGPAPS